MVTALEILKQYITCEDGGTRNKFFNLLDSFWHKKDGKVLKETIEGPDGSTTFKFLDENGNTESITIPGLPDSKGISFITGLSEALSNKVDKVPGKQLSTNDFSTALLSKLNSLVNYVHPEFHQIAEVEGLAQALADLAPPEGFGFSEVNFSPAYEQKLLSYPIGHYAAPVADLAALALIPEADIPNFQRRPVQGEKVDYFYDRDAVEGDVAPADQTEGTGFWVRADREFETRLAKVEGFELFANQANQEFYLKDADGNIKSTISVAFLNNEGTTFFYNETTKELELKNDAGEIVSNIPVSAFVSNLAKSINLTGSTFQLKDTEGNVLSSVQFEISNINGLAVALAGKQDQLPYTPADASKVTKTINTLIELREYVGTPGEHVNVLGRSKAGDGLVAPFPFYYSENETGEDNDATIIKVTDPETSAFIGQWETKIEGDVNVKWFGAKDELGFDNYSSLTKALAFSNHIVFPKSDYGYEISEKISIPYTIKYFNALSPIIYTGALEEPCLVFGEAGQVIDAADIEVNVKRSQGSDWSNENNIGVKIINANTCKINVFQSREFTIGVQCIGENGGFAYNKINLGALIGNKYDVDINNDSTLGTGWCNENSFFAGRFTCFSNQGAGISRYGVRITSKKGDYYNNSNVFYKPSFEKKADTASPGEAVPILMEYGVNNAFLEIRNEFNSPTTLRVLNESTENEVTTSYGLVEVEESGTFPYTKKVSGRQKVAYCSQKFIYKSGNIIDKTCYYNGDDKINIPGLHLATSSAGNNYDSLNGFVLNSDYLEYTSGRGVGIFVKTEKVKRFFISKDTINGNGGRVAIRAYDSSGDILTNAGEGHPYIKSNSYTTLSYFSGFGGVYRQGADTNGGLYFDVSEEVKKIAVLLVGGTNPIFLRSFYVSSFDVISEGASFSGLTNPINETKNIGTTFPTAGFWSKGKIVFNDIPSVGQPEGWICVTSGSPGTWQPFGKIGDVPNRPIKTVNNSTQYTFVDGDQYKHLVFTALAGDAIVPDGVFAESDLLEGTFKGGEVEVKSALDGSNNPLITLDYPATLTPVFAQKGLFGIKFTSANTVTLGGHQKPVE